MAEGKRRDRPSMQDVADMAGVSRQVVSAILAKRRRTSGYSEETRRRVLAIIAECGYRPNRASLKLKEKRHGLVALIFSSLGYLPPGDSLELMVSRLSELDYMLVMEQLAPHPGREALRIIAQDVVDAVVCFQDIDDRLLAQFSRIRLPVLAVNSNFDQPIPKILFDDIQGTRLVVEELRRRGRRDIAYLPTGDPGMPWNRDRIAAMCAMDGVDGVRCRSLALVAEPAFDRGYRFSNVAEILRDNPGLDAIILNHVHAHHGVLAEVVRCGRRVPEDIAIASFFAQRYGYGPANARPAGLQIDADGLSARIARSVSDLVEQAATEDAVIPYLWVEGSSC